MVSVVVFQSILYDGWRHLFFIYPFLVIVSVFGFRFLWDLYLQNNFLESFKHDADSFSTIGYSLDKITSFHGIYDVFSVYGFWILIPMYAWMKSSFKLNYKLNKESIVAVLYMVAVIFQMLLSGDIARMLYLSMPLFCLWIGRVIRWRSY